MGYLLQRFKKNEFHKPLFFKKIFFKFQGIFFFVKFRNDDIWKKYLKFVELPTNENNIQIL